MAGSDVSKRTWIGASYWPAPGSTQVVANCLSLPQSSATRNISITPLVYSSVSLWPLTRSGSPTHAGWNEPPWKFPVAGL